MVDNKKNNIVIIGTGLAGYMLAKEFRKLDTQTPLTFITKLDGYFYSKPLLSTALTHQKTPDELWMNKVETMRMQLNAEIYTHCEVFKIDSDNKKIFFHNEKNNKKELSYDKLILANGADHISIPLSGDAVSEIVSVNHLEDYRILREKIKNKKRIAIFGSGLVGCEFANDLTNAGFSVTMISPDNYLLKKFVPEIIARALQTALEKLGVKFYLSLFPKIINKKNLHDEIILSDNQKIETDLILSATGIKPNLLLAKSADVKTNIGIITNQYLQTSNENIFAIGDCAELNGEMKMYVAPIIHNARILAEILAGKTPLIENKIMPIVIKTPACPIVTVPPAKNITGEWKTDVDDVNCRALFYDKENHLRGFALSGNCVKEKMILVNRVHKL